MILQAEVCNNWSLDTVLERQIVHKALKFADENNFIGDVRIETVSNNTVEVYVVKVYPFYKEIVQ
jgi:hypothetical protein